MLFLQKAILLGLILIVNETENILEVQSGIEPSEDNDNAYDGVETIEITEKTAVLDFRISSKIFIGYSKAIKL